MFYTFLSKIFSKASRQKSAVRSPECPAHTLHGTKWHSFVNKILLDNGIIADIDTLLFFDRDPFSGDMQLLEYDGDIEKINQLAKNKPLMQNISMARTYWYTYLFDTKNASNETISWLVWDIKGNIIGIVALWAFDDNEPIDFDFIPLGIPVESISKISYAWEPTKKYEKRPYKFIKFYSIIECHELIDDEWTLTGLFDTELFAQKLIKPTLNTLPHLMDLYQQEIIKTRIKKQYPSTKCYSQGDNNAYKN